MLYNVRQSYTPSLVSSEFNTRALIIDTETVGVGPSIEIVEIALCDFYGEVVFNSLVRPIYNKPPRSTKDQRFDRAEFAGAPDWLDLWPQFSTLIDGKLLIAYNAAFDRRALAAMRARHRQSTNERGWRCAMQLIKERLGARKSVTLTEACAAYGLEGGNHRAARDVVATHCLLKAVLTPSN